jgi:ribosomal protein S20
LARTPRKWKGARSPSGLKRVRSAERREAILGPRRSAAKTAVRTAVAVATSPGGEDPQAALADAMSALDRAAKTGAIHPNAAARRKSRLAIRVNGLAGGVAGAAGHGKTVSRTAAQKAAKARIAAGKADKAKGAQTAAGKARAALSRTSRADADGAAPKAAAKPAAKAPAKATPKPAAKGASKPAAKSGSKPAAKSSAKK